MLGDNSSSGIWWPLTLLFALLSGAALFTSGGAGNAGKPSGVSSGENSPLTGISQVTLTESQLEMGRQSRLERPLRSYLGLRHPACVPTALKLSGSRVKFLICTLPDPTDSEFGVNFDPMLDTLQYALSRDGFILDRYYLPWQEYERIQIEKKDANDAHGQRLYEMEPGVLLFRNDKEESGPVPLLLVYIVGETPTAGIHKLAFRRAVEQIKRLRPTTHAEELKILGPTVTGAAESLDWAIRQSVRRADFSGVDVISGSATGVKPSQIGHRDGCDPTDVHEVTVEFSTTTVHNEEQTKALLDFLEDRQTLPVRRKVAWLVEANTSFGQLVEKESVNYQKVKADWERVIFRFPLHISRVRSAFVEARRGENAPIPQPRRRYELEVPLEELRTGRDLPPRFSPTVTAANAELLLGQIMDTIRRDGIRYVAITASDARDRVFLCDFIRTHFRSVQILLVSNDLIYSHSDSIESLVGALVVSPYPLFPENEHWSFPYAGRQEHVVLSSALAKGLYNAVGLLLHPEWREESKCTGPIHLTDYGPPFPPTGSNAKLTPQSWISVVGSDGIFPLRATALKCGSTYTLEATNTPVSGDAKQRGASGNFYMAGRSLVLWLVLLGLAVFSFAGTWRHCSPDQINPFAGTSRRLALTACTVPAALLLFWVVMQMRVPLFQVDTTELEWLTGINYLIFAVSALASAALLVVWSDVFAVGQVGSLSRRAGVTVVLAIAMMAFARWDDPQEAHAEHALTFVRTFTISSSVSIFPSMVFLAAAHFAWGYPQLKLDAWRREYRVAAPWLKSKPPPAQGAIKISLDSLNSKTLTLEQTAELPWKCSESPWDVRMWIAVAALSLWLAYLWWHSVPTVEAVYLTVMIQFAIGVLLVLGAVGLSRSLMLRKQLIEVLRAMSQFDLKSAFQRVRDEDQSGLERFLSSRRLPGGDVRRLLQLYHARRNEAAESYFGWTQDDALSLITANRKFVKKSVREARKDWRRIFVDVGPSGGYSQSVSSSAKLLELNERSRDLIAMHVKLYLQNYISQLRMMRNALWIMALLLLLAVLSYPLQPQQLLVLTVALLVAAVGAMAIWNFVALDRDKVLSQIVDTDENKVNWDWDFAVKALPWIFVGMVLLMSQMFPDTWSWVRTYLTPISHIKS